MMGPEAALVNERLAQLRGLGGYVGPIPPPAGPMYAEAAVRAHLDPPVLRPGVWVRLRAALRGRGARAVDPAAAWTVAAAPIVAKDLPAGEVPRPGVEDGLLAALPLQRARDV